LGFDGSVTLGFDLGNRPSPGFRPTIQLIYNRVRIGKIDPTLLQIRVIDTENCTACESFDGCCKVPTACRDKIAKEATDAAAKKKKEALPQDE